MQADIDKLKKQYLESFEVQKPLVSKKRSCKSNRNRQRKKNFKRRYFCKINRIIKIYTKIILNYLKNQKILAEIHKNCYNLIKVKQLNIKHK